MTCLGGIFDYAHKSERLQEVERELEDPDVWNEPERAQALGKERSLLEGIVSTIEQLTSGLEDASELLEMSVEEQDEDGVEGVVEEQDQLSEKLEELEFFFSGIFDLSNQALKVDDPFAFISLIRLWLFFIGKTGERQSSQGKG